ncbi:DUF2336 domain-containing protein [Streptomyces sp. RY43-2]|uniref:DUF2336 domain-containing protein n=1 Tax=Streptomyces macrolidinus TaxID=2952607 RepID=A0ABT0ZIE1_9ACTN|nr:DUF2336 domain-containing protein [Streptomyces macrolidinus]MCN9243364.1 DUF2336 domain-containing protein [Streptomyces macrolidinus]
MNHVLLGLAANAALPAESVDRLIAIADADVTGFGDIGDLAGELAGRTDLSHEQAVALVSRAEECAARLARAGRLTAVDIDPVAQPRAALALLYEGVGSPEWARLLAADPVVERREELAACPDLPPDVVRTLAADSDVRVVVELALWAAPEVTGRLAEHPHAEVRRAVAVNEATPPAVLAALVTGEGLPPARRCLVCDREETPFVHDPHCPRLDCELPPGASCDGSHESTLHALQQAALRNPATPADAVVDFVGHPSMLLRWALAARPGLPPEVYGQLAADPVPGVRADLAENPAIGDALIRGLAEDRSSDVRRGVAFNPRVPLDVLIRLAATTKIGDVLVPRIASASPAEVEELARSAHPAARMLLAQRRDLPREVRDALVHDRDAKVARSIAAHPGLSEGQLRTLVDRHGARVLAKVAANPDASPALLDDLARHEPPVPRALREIARHRHATAPALVVCLTDDRARPVAAGHPALPPPVIVELLADQDWQVVQAAAANPSLPPAVMSDLLRGL